VLLVTLIFGSFKFFAVRTLFETTSYLGVRVEVAVGAGAGGVKRPVAKVCEAIHVDAVRLGPA
jgi:hypothetical protein